MTASTEPLQRSYTLIEGTHEHTETSSVVPVVSVTPFVSVIAVDDDDPVVVGPVLLGLGPVLPDESSVPWVLGLVPVSAGHPVNRPINTSSPGTARIIIDRYHEKPPLSR